MIILLDFPLNIFKHVLTRAFTAVIIYCPDCPGEVKLNFVEALHIEGKNFRLNDGIKVLIKNVLITSHAPSCMYSTTEDVLEISERERLFPHLCRYIDKYLI